MQLKVTQPFGRFAVGDAITEEDEIKTVLASEQSAYVVKVPDEPAPQAVGKKTK